MPTITKLPSGKWRVQVRRAGVYRNGTFSTKREALDWGARIETQVNHIAAGGFAPIPRDVTVADLIDKYNESFQKESGKTKTATLNMLKREFGKVQLRDFSAFVLGDFVDRRIKDGAGGVTIAGDLSFLTSVFDWGRQFRKIDLPVQVIRDARASLKHAGLNTRGNERTREPTDEELRRLYAYWASKPRMQIDMELLCRFALASAMRQEEICMLQADDVDRDKRTVIIRDRKDPREKVGNDQIVPLLPDAWSIIDALLPGREGCRIFNANPHSVSTAFTKACKELGIEDLHFHDLRHRATAQLFRMGLDIPRVALMTGHKTWAMLKRYTSMKSDDVHIAFAQHADAMANIIPIQRNRAAR